MKRHSPFRAFVLLVLVLALGAHARLHLAGLQVVAWSGMILTYSQAANLPDAIEMTFNGQNPCSLCKVVSNAASDSNPEFTAPAPTQPLLLLADWSAAWEWTPCLCYAAVCEMDLFIAAEPLRPPLPPPRGLA